MRPPLVNPLVNDEARAGAQGGGSQRAVRVDVAPGRRPPVVGAREDDEDEAHGSHGREGRVRPLRRRARPLERRAQQQGGGGEGQRQVVAGGLRLVRRIRRPALVSRRGRAHQEALEARHARQREDHQGGEEPEVLHVAQEHTREAHGHAQPLDALYHHFLLRRIRLDAFGRRRLHVLRAAAERLDERRGARLAGAAAGAVGHGRRRPSSDALAPQVGRPRRRRAERGGLAHRLRSVAAHVSLRSGAFCSANAPVSCAARVWTVSTAMSRIGPGCCFAKTSRAFPGKRCFSADPASNPHAKSCQGWSSESY
mmetsp:Transcript_22923/g.68816  ORF Transcript_22923/g.68816 Transcript_22923/m.68816 type:complete len:311 (-) Transcript_22923:74-1006(-)